MDFEAPKASGEGGASSSKNLLVIIGSALALVLVIAVVLVVTLSGSANKATLQNVNPNSLGKNGIILSKAESMKPALTMTYMGYLLQKRWPLFAGVGALLVVAVVLLFAVPAFLNSRHPPVDEEPKKKDSYVDVFDAPWKIGAVIGGLILLILVVVGLIYKFKPTGAATTTATTTTTALTATAGTAGTAGSPGSTPKDPNCDPLRIISMISSNMYNPYLRLAALVAFAKHTRTQLSKSFLILSQIAAENKVNTLNNVLCFDHNVHNGLEIMWDEAAANFSAADEKELTLFGNKLWHHVEKFKTCHDLCKLFTEKCETHGLQDVKDKASGDLFLSHFV